MHAETSHISETENRETYKAQKYHHINLLTERRGEEDT